MQSRFNFDSSTKVIGVIGHPIKQSLSPLMHNSAFQIAGLNFIYLPFDIPAENLGDAFKGMVALGLKGFSVTLPLKEKVLQYLNKISEEASVIGAVNTIVNENGILHGYNTDVHGITESLMPFKEKFNGENVTIVGAGGAARSAIYSLIRNFKPEQINIINRTEQTAESLKDYFSVKMHFNNFKIFELFPPELVDVFQKSKLIINTSSVGMFPETEDTVTTISESFNKKQIVFDVVYNPLRTSFLKLAEAQGAKCIKGLKMFVEQGAKSYEIWTGESMPIKEVYAVLEKYLKNDPETLKETL